MAVGCIIYPNAFDDPNFKRICGQDAKAYDTDKCQIRWAYILGIVLVFDALILSILAFILASCQAKSIPEMKEKIDGKFQFYSFDIYFVRVASLTLAQMTHFRLFQTW